MRIGPEDQVWVVVDPTPESKEEDLAFRVTFGGLALLLKGGHATDRNPTLFTEERQAKVEAFGRLTAMRAARAVREKLCRGEDVELPLSIQIHGARGETIYEVVLDADALARIKARRDGE